MTNYVVVIRYSFDSDVPVFIFNNEQECIDFINKEFIKDTVIATDIDETFISDDGTYACITYRDNESIEWYSIYTTDKRGAIK